MPVYKDNTTGSWFVKCYYSDYTGARKQKFKRGFKLQREAKEWERNFLEQQQGSPDMTFQSLYELYMEDISHRMRVGSIRSKKNIFINRILPYFKDKPVNAITPIDIRSWQNEHLSRGYSDAYLRQIHNTMSAIMNYAINYYNLPSNPCKRAGRMGKTTVSMTFWTLEQYNQVMPFITAPSSNIVMQMLFYSGMRIGELLALTPSDIDYQANTIRITKALQRLDGKDVLSPPKTENGVRTISMPVAIMNDLRTYCSKLYGLQSNDLIFMVSKHTIRYHMLRASESANQPFIRIHDLRHSHVSLLIDMGFTPHLIAERIGDTVQMVNNIYGHLYPNKHEEVANKLNEIIVSN